MGGSLDGVEKEMRGMRGERSGVLDKSNVLGEDIEGKWEGVKTVVDCVKGVGESMQEVNKWIKRV